MANMSEKIRRNVNKRYTTGDKLAAGILGAGVLSVIAALGFPYQKDHSVKADIISQAENAGPTHGAADTSAHNAPTSPKPSVRPKTKLTPNVLATPSKLPTPTPVVTPTPKATPTTPEVAKAPLIVLDPGHDGQSRGLDPKHPWMDPAGTGLHMREYPNLPERTEVFHVATLVKQALQADGYRVLMTKSAADDSASYRQRAELAIQNHADLEVIIHDDHGALPQAMQWVTPQRVGGYRIGSKGKVSCENPQIEQESVLAATAIAHARTAALPQYPAILHPLNFDSRGDGMDPGNLSQIQLMDCIDQNPVPAVYNEMGALTGGNVKTPAPETQLQAYARGLVNGIEAAVPIG